MINSLRIALSIAVLHWSLSFSLWHTNVALDNIILLFVIFLRTLLRFKDFSKLV